MILSLSHGALNALDIDEHAVRLVLRWQRLLAIDAYEARLEQVDPMQVTGEDGRPGAELVGVVIEATHFTVLHTRPLDDSDVVHELLHVARPAWDHEAIEHWTDRLLAGDLALLPHEGAPSYPAEESGKDTPMEIKAYNLRTRKPCTVLNPEIVTMKTGRKAVRGVASDDEKTRVFRILSEAEVAQFKATNA
jgi:hypothetical protein